MAIETGTGSVSPQRSRRSGITRRAVVGAALAGGTGIAALRLLGLAQAPPAVRGGGGTNWISPLNRENAQVLQLLRRATFGASGAGLERALSDGYSKTVARLVETPPAMAGDLPGGDVATRSAPIKLAQLQGWLLDKMLASPTPFAERMTMFWHGHFTSDYRKVGLQSPFVYWQNQTWRRNSLGDLRTFLYEVTIDPAMLRYLDLATSTGQSPNENYSRELMELFTMGAGSFSEADVRAAARALAGWREPKTLAMVQSQKMDPKLTPAQQAKVDPTYDTEKTGVFVPQRAHKGQLTFLGRTGSFDTRSVIDQILAQKATAPHIVRRVLADFVMPNPPDATVNRLAGGFVKSKWSIRQLMHDVFMSDEFRAAANYRSLVKQPVEFMVQALRALEAPARTATALQYSSGMGQVLFDPPDVGGWPTNASWITSNTVLARVNFVTTLVAAVKKLPASEKAHQDHLDGVLSPATAKLLSSATTDQERWTLVLASPEFQLK